MYDSSRFDLNKELLDAYDKLDWFANVGTGAGKGLSPSKVVRFRQFKWVNTFVTDMIGDESHSIFSGIPYMITDLHEFNDIAYSEIHQRYQQKIKQGLIEHGFEKDLDYMFNQIEAEIKMQLIYTSAVGHQISHYTASSIDIYLSGHMTAGWIGRYPAGEFRIY
jgi:hypothetical protein